MGSAAGWRGRGRGSGRAKRDLAVVSAVHDGVGEVSPVEVGALRENLHTGARWARMRRDLEEGDRLVDASGAA